MIRVHLSGDTDRLHAVLAAAPAQARALNSAVVRKTSADIERTAQTLAAYDTGLLRNSIHATTKTGGNIATGTIAPGTNYASYVEYGTSRMRAQPFMRPAHDRHRAVMVKAVNQIPAMVLK